MTIEVQTPAGDIIALQMYMFNTIEGVKAGIEDEEGFPRDQQRLIFKQTEFPDSHTLSSCYTFTKATPRFQLRLRDELQFFCKNTDEKYNYIGIGAV